MDYLFAIGIWMMIGAALYALFMAYRWAVNEVAYRRRLRERLRRV